MQVRHPSGFPFDSAMQAGIYHKETGRFNSIGDMRAAKKMGFNRSTVWEEGFRRAYRRMPLIIRVTNQRKYADT